MKRSALKVLQLTGLALATIGFAVLIGCESEDSPDTENVDSYFDENPYSSDPRVQGPSDVAISPVQASIDEVGQHVTFEGLNGEGPYEWRVTYNDRGTVSILGWSQGIYTATKVEYNQVIVVDQHGHSAIAEIITSASTSTPPVEPENLTISTSDATLEDNGDKTVLTANGGLPPYTWTVPNIALGNIDSSTGTSVVYQRNAAGDNSVKVTDSVGDVANIVIQQP